MSPGSRQIFQRPSRKDLARGTRALVGDRTLKAFSLEGKVKLTLTLFRFEQLQRKTLGLTFEAPERSPSEREVRRPRKGLLPSVL